MHFLFKCKKKLIGRWILDIWNVVLLWEEC